MLEIKNLQVYRGENVIISEASLSLSQGEVIRIDGANGSGKSTLLSAIFGVHGAQVKSGQISLGGVSLVGLLTHEIAKRKIFYAVQTPPVIKGVRTLQFLYKSYKNYHPESTDNILVWKDKLEKKCILYGLDFGYIGDEVNAKLSGGEKKLAQLIHILAIEPKILVIDEPDSGVDIKNRDKVYDFINKMSNDGKSIIYTSHASDHKKVKVNRVYQLENKILKIL
jgi:Fe-S cluster assembly ATP-binding protein